MRAIEAAREGGSFVWIRSEDPSGPSLERGVHGGMFYARADGASLRAIAALIETAKVSVHLDRVFTLDQVREAYRLSDTGHVRGKISVSVGVAD